MRARFDRGTRRQKKRDDRRVWHQQKKAREPDGPRRDRHDDGGGGDWEDDWHDDGPDIRPRARSSRRKRAGAKDVPRTTEPNGLVVAATAGRVEIWSDGTVYGARLAPELRARQQHAIAIGDEVAWRADGDDALVVAVAQRRTSLSRPDPGNPHLQRVLVANVDRAVIVLSAAQPALRPALVDRLLVALTTGGVEPVLCINKLDLAVPGSAERHAVDACLALYRRLGVRCEAVSAHAGTGIDRLRDAIRSATSVFVGHSGVGKTALLNAFDPDKERATGPGRAFDGKGRHTTRGSTLTFLEDANARVIDTPGVRAFGLWNIDAATLSRCFPDFTGLPTCRFTDCLHVEEAGCAVLDAIRAGKLAQERYDAYRKLLE